MRTPAGMRTLDRGAVVAFPRGPAGAHRITNAGSNPARVLIVSTMNLPEVAEYPDTRTVVVVVVTGPDQRRAFPAQAAVSLEQRVVEARRAGDQHKSLGGR